MVDKWNNFAFRFSGGLQPQTFRTNPRSTFTIPDVLMMNRIKSIKSLRVGSLTSWLPGKIAISTSPANAAGKGNPPTVLADRRSGRASPT
jgi:hypothetical protein